MLTSNKINNINIEAVIDNTKINPKKIVGYNYFTEPYCNVMLNARKKAGKTTVVYRALEACVTKGMNVMLFAPTVNHDPTYAKMIKMLVKKGCNVKTFEHFIDENGVDHVKLLLNELILQKNKTDNKKEDLSRPLGECYADFGKSRKVEDNKVKKKSSLIKPDYILVFDDLSMSMRHPTISRLMTYNRHYKMKTFICCHDIMNMDQMASNSIDYYILFPNIPQEKVFKLCERVGLDFKTDTSKCKKIWDIYEMATSKPYNFLYISKESFEFRHNFDKLINV